MKCFSYHGFPVKSSNICTVINRHLKVLENWHYAPLGPSVSRGAGEQEGVGLGY